MKKEWFDSVLEIIEPWLEEAATGQRYVWLRCYGLPISLLNKDCFSKIIGKHVSQVTIDEATVSWNNLEFARIQVRLCKMHFAKFSTGIQINGNI